MNLHHVYRGARLVSVAGLTAIVLTTTLFGFTPATDRPAIAQHWAGLVHGRSAPNHTLVNLLVLLVALNVMSAQVSWQQTDSDP